MFKVADTAGSDWFKNNIFVAGKIRLQFKPAFVFQNFLDFLALIKAQKIIIVK